MNSYSAEVLRSRMECELCLKDNCDTKCKTAKNVYTYKDIERAYKEAIALLENASNCETTLKRCENTNVKRFEFLNHALLYIGISKTYMVFDSKGHQLAYGHLGDVPSDGHCKSIIEAVILNSIPLRNGKEKRKDEA